ncbi:MAG: rhomboid family intramembrane serine protease [Pseudomonadota bacterium]
MSQDPDAAPINPLPAAVVILALPIVLMEFAFIAGAEGFLGGPEAVGWRLSALKSYGFIPAVFDAASQTGRWSLAVVLPLLSYSFIHLSFMHMVMVLVFLLALGKLVGEVMGSRAVFAIFFGSAIAGGLALALLTDSAYPLAGGYPAVYGLIGGYTFILRARLIADGSPGRQAFTLIGVLLFIQLVFGLLFGSGPDWIAEIAGFGAGFAVSPLLLPGGFSRILARLRSR